MKREREGRKAGERERERGGACERAVQKVDSAPEFQNVLTESAVHVGWKLNAIRIRKHEVNRLI